MIKADGGDWHCPPPSLPSLKVELATTAARSLARRNSCGQREHHTIEGFLAVAVLQLAARLTALSSAKRERTR